MFKETKTRSRASRRALPIDPRRWPEGLRACLKRCIVWALPVVVALPAAAAPQVVIQSVAPLYDGDFVYSKLAGATQADPSVGRLAVDVYLRNDEAFPVEIDHVTLSFAQPALAPIQIEAGLRMWCPFPAPSGTPLLTQAAGLVMQPGEFCRLGLMPDPLLPLPTADRLRVTVFFTGYVIGLSDSERDLIEHVNPTPTGGYRFPARYSDLAAGEFWSARSPLSGTSHRFGASHDQSLHAYDMGVVRFDAGEDAWASYHPLGVGETVPDENSDYLVWGLPVFAMADGVVLNCSDGNLDDTPVMDNGSTANSFTIQHGDEVAWYGHLRNGSTNPAVCFVGATVEEGQFLGEVGNSGMSTQPHLHVQVLRNGDPMPLLFNDSFVLERDTSFPGQPNGNGPWSALASHGLPPDNTVIWPSGLRRRGSFNSLIPTVDNVLTTTSNSRTVTASRTAGGNLRVVLWSTGTSGDVTVLDEDLGGAVNGLSLATPNGTNDAALALITGGGSLKLIGYDVVGGSLQRTVDYSLGSAMGVVASSAPFSDGIVTAVRTQFGNLKVIAWRVDPQAGVIQRRGEDVGGAVQEMAMVRTVVFPGVVAAVRTGAGNLKLMTFRVVFNGFSVSREDDYEDDEVQDVSIARLGPVPGGGELVVTASRTLAGNLELISWLISDAGDITRLDDAQAGAILEVSAARATQRHVLTAIADSSGNLKVIAWHVADDGTITRRTDMTGGAASAIALANTTALLFSDPNLGVVALSDGAGDLRMIAIDTNLRN